MINITDVHSLTYNRLIRKREFDVLKTSAEHFFTEKYRSTIQKTGKSNVIAEKQNEQEK